MRYTDEDIIIREWYLDNGSMGIEYFIKGEASPNLHMFPSSALLENLMELGYCSEIDLKDQTVKTKEGIWQRFSMFIEQTISNETAGNLILHYLNNKAVKP